MASCFIIVGSYCRPMDQQFSLLVCVLFIVEWTVLNLFSPVPVSPIKRKHARSLYQYINCSSAAESGHREPPPQHNPISDPQCTSVLLDDVQRPEEHDPGHSSTASDPETGML